jgi:hypothetical protein
MRPASATPAKKEFIFVPYYAESQKCIARKNIEQESKKQTTNTSHTKTKKKTLEVVQNTTRIKSVVSEYFNQIPSQYPSFSLPVLKLFPSHFRTSSVFCL